MRMIKDEDQEEGQGINIMPLIDIVFLLLVYFILTMTFAPDEKWIASLLNGGGTGDGPIENHEVNISFFPAHAPHTNKPSEMQKWYENTDVKEIECRVNGSSIVLNKFEDHEVQVEKIHTFILEQLAKSELHVATREQQDPIKVHCFRRLPWRYALAGFDAVRAYEKQITGQNEVVLKRQFGFAPNERRDARQYFLGNEILRLRNLK